MRSGRLKQIVSIERPLNTVDPRSGQRLRQSADSWEQVAQVWAGVEPLRGRELYAAQQYNSEITVKVVMRWHSELARLIDHSCTVLHDGVRYQILHDPINPNMANRELQLLCKVVR